MTKLSLAGYRLIKESGPYTVKSLPNGEMRIIPTWSQMPPWNAQDGGGPSFGDRLELAQALEKWLNRGHR